MDGVLRVKGQGIQRFRGAETLDFSPKARDVALPCGSAGLPPWSPC